MVINQQGVRQDRELPRLSAFELLRESREVTELDRVLLILTANAETQATISRVLRVHKGTVSKYVKRARLRARMVLDVF